ncbi:spore cortex biosynthesis protein YabQ [Proteinivorax hydrogeniformans]|uniref:Spore cortex biosynthesis protein YabQ n=1 Tax=Proteinivorax hydrogeniformans TaxID=1826727 RepID=A0AAU8HTZ6_9FIRM
MDSLALQGYIFLVMVALGILLGILFDVYRFIKGRTGLKGLPLYLCDGIFWVIITAIAFFVLLLSNWAQLRVYIFLSIFAGFIFHIMVISKSFIKVLIKIEKILIYIWKIIRKIAKVIYNIVASIFKVIAKVISIILWPITYPVKTLCSFAYKKSKSTSVITKIIQKLSRRK